MGFFGGGSSVDLASPPAIGSTTPNTGAFTSLTVKASTGLTDRSITGSGTNSGLSIEASNAYILTANQYATRFGRGGDLGVTIRSDSAFGITSGNADATTDTILRRDAANTFAQRNSTSRCGLNELCRCGIEPHAETHRILVTHSLQPNGNPPCAVGGPSRRFERNRA